VLPFFVTARYRLPMMALLAVLAGPFLDAWIDRLRQRKPPDGLGAATVAAGIALVVSWLPLLPRSNHAAAHVNLGALHAELGETEAARRELERALEVAPRDPRAMENLGMIALRTGRVEEALTWAERSLSVDARSAGAWNLRGAALGHLERYDEAIAAFERVLAMRPGEPSATQNLSYTWQRYLARCRTIAGELGLEDLTAAGTRERLATELEARGYRRAASRLRGEDRPPPSSSR
jgi:tetratricopeptide (TPR) repeat protein